MWKSMELSTLDKKIKVLYFPKIEKLKAVDAQKDEGLLY